MKKIGEVKLNYEYYKETDIHQESAIYDTLLKIVEENEILEDVLIQNRDASILYHFSPIRQNVLRWYEFERGKTVLEIGAGCGTISGLLCEKADRVVAVEESKKQAEINAVRNKECNNLEIYVGNFGGIELEEKFDYITLIDVLANAGDYFNSKTPFEDMLKKVKNMLKPNGKLFIAIENKYGMKYWAGAPEEHIGSVFTGIYGYVEENIKTFSKGTLKKMLETAGFTKNNFYYPVPDYRMPMEIYSEGYLPKSGDIKNSSPAYDKDRYEFFQENLAYDSVCEDGLFEEFANSFIVVSE